MSSEWPKLYSDTLGKNYKTAVEHSNNLIGNLRSEYLEEIKELGAEYRNLRFEVTLLDEMLSTRVKQISESQVFLRKLDSLEVRNFNLDITDLHLETMKRSLVYGIPYLKLKGLPRDPIKLKELISSLDDVEVRSFFEEVSRICVDHAFKGFVTLESTDTIGDDC